MAVARARFEACPVILVSATPALDTAWRMGRIGNGPPDGADDGAHGCTVGIADAAANAPRAAPCCCRPGTAVAPCPRCS